MLRIRCWSIVLLVCCWVRVAGAQASLVPAAHPIYDWLNDQRIAGRLPTYEHEIRPMARAVILGHLRTLAALNGQLSTSERRLLQDFHNEFDMDRLVAQRIWTGPFLRGIPRSIGAAVRDRKDPVLLTYATEDSVLSGAVYASIGGGRLALTTQGSAPSASTVTSKGIRAFLNARYGVGWHFEADNIWTSRDAALIRMIPRYNTEAMKPGSTSSYEYESFLSYRTARYLELAVGRGAEVLGAAVVDPLVLRAEAPFFASMRLRLGTPRFNLVYLHGALASDAMVDSVRTTSGMIATRVAPPRFFVSHRLTWMPTPRLSLAVHEEMIYSNRGIDLNYLNPVVPMVLAQNRLGDRDNLLIGGEVIYRPFDGTQLLGSLLIDDLGQPGDPAAPIIGVPIVHGKLATMVGLEQRLVPGVRLGVSYTTTDPFLYSHWQPLNAYADHGQPLGAALGSNGEELAVRLTGWLPLRTRLMVGARAIRRGLDPVNSAGVVTCVGGNLLCGLSRSGIPRFQGADLHTIRRVELELETELIRGLPVALRIRDDQVTRGTQLRSQRFTDLRFRYGY